MQHKDKRPCAPQSTHSYCRGRKKEAPRGRTGRCQRLDSGEGTSPDGVCFGSLSTLCLIFFYLLPMGERYNLYFPEEAKSIATEEERGSLRPWWRTLESGQRHWTHREEIPPTELREKSTTADGAEDRIGNRSMWNIVRNEYPGDWTPGSASS